HNDGLFISARGKDIIVIGGGDTGTDCVATALRHDCNSITQFQYRDMPPTERKASQPWPLFPQLFQQDYGQEEAKARFGLDPRRYGVLAKRFVGDDNGHVKELHTVEVEWRNECGDGVLRPVEIK